MTAIERWHDYLKNRLVRNVVAAILLGLLLGRFAMVHANGYGRVADAAILTCVFMMIFPMMVTIRLEAFLAAARNIKGVFLSVMYNFVWAPVVGYFLASTFLDQSEVAFGFLLVMTVPCSNMAIGYTGITKGNVELATIIVAVSFLLALAGVPIWLALLAGQFDVPVPYLLLGRALLVTLVLPMIFGTTTRRLLVGWRGPENFARMAPVFPAITLNSMLGSIFLIFFSMAPTLLEQWRLMLWLMVPNLLFMAGTFVLVTVINRLMGVPYADNMAIAFSSTGKNNATTVAIATATFSPLVAVPAATLPIFQVTFMIIYIRLAAWLVVRFGDRQTPRGFEEFKTCVHFVPPQRQPPCCFSLPFRPVRRSRSRTSISAMRRSGDRTLR